MLYRKIEPYLRQYFREKRRKILVVSGARQVGKSFIINHVGSEMFKNFVQLNFLTNRKMREAFNKVETVEDFYLQLSVFAGPNLGTKEDTLVFLDEIQECEHLLTLLKFLREEDRFRYVASGSLLGVTLKRTTSVPIGSIEIKHMYPLDFEEFLIANNFGPEAIDYLKECYRELKSPEPSVHERTMYLFRRYLLVGGMPDAVNEFIETHNLSRIRDIQTDIHHLYEVDASKYDEEHRLAIKRVYDLIPSNMESKKKRIVYSKIEEGKKKRSSDYEEEMEYLISSGVALEVKAISNPRFPLIETEFKNLLKLYLNDVGLLSNILYRMNPDPILEDEDSINLGSLYECAVAEQLVSNGHRLFYYDNRNHGEVDFLIDDYRSLSVLPIEVKSGKDYRVHRAISRFVTVPDYHIKFGYVLSNSGVIERRDNIIYLPVYFTLFFNSTGSDNDAEILI